MPLAAQQVVDLVAADVRAVADYAASTYTDRAWAFDEAELPAARVLADAENVDTGTIHVPNVEIHDLDVAVQLRVQAATGLDAVMHDATGSVLASLFRPAAVAARGALNVQAFALTRIDRQMLVSDQAKVGVVDIVLRARFAVIANNPNFIA